jgi:hypothetical protein
MKPLTKTQIECLHYLHEHPGATYDKIPFRGATLKALERLWMVQGGWMMPRITNLGRLAIGAKTR